MADTKASALTELTSLSGDETFYVVDDDDGTPTSKRITGENLAAGINATAPAQVMRWSTGSSAYVADTTTIYIDADGTHDPSDADGLWLRPDVVIPADKTADYTLALTDASLSLGVSSATAKNVTVPPNSSVAFPIGTTIEVRQVGAGQVTIVAGSGVTLRSADSALKLRVQYSTASLLKVATDTWSVAGDLTV